MITARNKELRYLGYGPGSVWNSSPPKKRKKETQKFGDLAGRALHQLPERGVIYTS